MTTEDIARKIIVELDGIARDVGHREFGLPLLDDGTVERMIDVVKSAIDAAVSAERERCAALMEEFVTDQPGIGKSFWGEAFVKIIREGKQ